MRFPPGARGFTIVFAIGLLGSAQIAAAQRTDTPDLDAGHGSVPQQLGPTEACGDGLVDDDGTTETGYGWVPSVIEGIFAQEYMGEEVESRALRSVCVCWIRTRNDDTIDFEVVLYEFNSAEDMPQKQPYAAFPARLSDIPMGIPGATFTEVELGDVPVPDGKFYVGVRWNASVDQFFFSCVDKTPRPAPPTLVYFRDDRSRGWGNSATTNDPTFDNHQAMQIRPVPSAPSTAQPADIPLGDDAATLFVAALLVAGWTVLRRT